MFDPLQYLSPAMMKMQFFLYKLWHQEKDWYDEMNQKDVRDWRKMMEDLKKKKKYQRQQYTGIFETKTDN